MKKYQKTFKLEYRLLSFGIRTCLPVLIGIFDKICEQGMKGTWSTLQLHNYLIFGKNLLYIQHFCVSHNVFLLPFILHDLFGVLCGFPQHNICLFNTSSSRRICKTKTTQTMVRHKVLCSLFSAKFFRNKTLRLLFSSKARGTFFKF